MRRFTTSHGATVKFMYESAQKDAKEGEAQAVVPDAVSQRVLNRSFMIDWPVNVGAVGIPQKRLAAVQLILPFSQSFQRCVHIIAHAAVLPEPRFEVHAAFEVSDIHPCSLINGLPEQHLEQYCLA